MRALTMATFPAAGSAIPDEVLTASITGRHLRGRTLGGHLGEVPTVLAFLRQFG
jgi:hypothetical protein